MFALPRWTKSRTTIFCLAGALALSACSSPDPVAPHGFDPKAESFESVESAQGVDSKPTSEPRARVHVSEGSVRNADLRPIVRSTGSRGPAAASVADFEIADVSSLQIKKEQKISTSRAPASASREPANELGSECKTGYECPDGQFCAERPDGIKRCVGGSEKLSYCQSSADCPNGTCRTRADGVKLCMGSGIGGSACDSNVDCSVGVCRDRGDGVKLCMGNGKRNDICTTSSDCAAGICKNRGDGLKICM